MVATVVGHAWILSVKSIVRTVVGYLFVSALTGGADLVRADPADGDSAAIRVKDLGRIQGWRENALVGYGLVSGLAGTGDSVSNRATRQALANVLSQFNQTIPPDQIQSRNVAIVMVTAALPVAAREGDTLDVTVSSSGDARSLVGGALLLTPMKAANGRIYALAQGPLSVGGYRYDANGNVVQKNHPTVGSIPGGATVEVGMPARGGSTPSQVTFVLHSADYTTAERVATAINRAIGSDVALARDATGIEIQIPQEQQSSPVRFFASIEGVWVEPDRRAKVVINERTGTVVTGGDVRIANVAVSHGDLRVSVVAETSVSQPILIGSVAPGARTAFVRNSQLDVAESQSGGFVSGSNTVADLVQALTRLRTSTRDIISILRAVKAAGALHAELIVQ
jgi:flagellar P-ring protein FlgI